MSKQELNFYDKTNLKLYNLDATMRYQLAMLDQLDVFTRKHCESVANYTCRLCEYLNCSKDFTVYCTTCAYLHDIGKLFIPPEILQCPRALTEEEYAVMKTHAELGYRMCMKDLKLRKYAAGAKYHHESLNGTGYPDGLTKKDIPIEGQIIRVADEYDAIVNKRQYKSHIDISETLKILVENAKPQIKDPKTGEVRHCKYGKINPKVLKALFKVVIDDVEYEISTMCDYVSSLEKEIKRIKQVFPYYKKFMNSTNEKVKQECFESAKYYLKKNEPLTEVEQIYNEYINTLAEKKETMKKLYNEIKKIKKLHV